MGKLRLQILLLHRFTGDSYIIVQKAWGDQIGHP